MKIVDGECKRRKNPRKCLKHFRILVEEGKDVEEIFKLEREQKKIENNQNGELSKRLDLLEEKTDHGCHAKINSILKKVLKKLQMSQDVENKAYEMVEEMMMDRDLPIDSDEY